MKAAPNLNFTTIKPEQKSLDTFVQMIKQVYQNLIGVINGNIGFGDGTNADNINGVWSNLTTPVAPNTDFTVTHNLQRIPVGYLVMQKDRAVDIYTGSIAPTSTQITLRATVASALVRLFIFSLLLGFFALRSSAQGAAYQNIALKSITPSGSSIGFSGPVLQPISGAIITVCTGFTLPATGTVCTGLTAIYSDIALTQALFNPTNADINGNYVFFAAAGASYVISVSGAGVTPYSSVWTAPIVAASAGANTALSNLVAVNINTSLLPQVGVDLGSSAKQFRSLYLYGSGVYGTNYFVDTGTPTAIRVQTKQDVSDTYVYRNSTDTLVNKTLSSPIINTPTINGTGGLLTLPAGPDTLVGRNTTDTLTNKTLTNPVINGTVTGTALQGTDNKLMTAGTIAGTGVGLCTDVNGGATTVGCGTTKTQIANLGSASCTPLAGASFNQCTSTVSWPSNFADTNYRVVCMGIGGPTDPRVMVQGVQSKAVGSVVVLLVTEGSSSGNFSDLDCIGIHP